MSKYSSDYKTDSVHVRHVLTHTSEGLPGTRYEYNGDLFAYLVHDTNFCVLLNRVGRSAANADGYPDSGFNITFYAGPAFFQDYEAYYLKQSKPRQTAQTPVCE